MEEYKKLHEYEQKKFEEMVEQVYADEKKNPCYVVGCVRLRNNALGLDVTLIRVQNMFLCPNVVTSLFFELLLEFFFKESGHFPRLTHYTLVVENIFTAI